MTLKTLFTVVTFLYVNLLVANILVISHEMLI